MHVLFHAAVWGTLHLPGLLPTGGGSVWFPQCGTALVAVAETAALCQQRAVQPRRRRLRGDKWKHMSGTKQTSEEERIFSV